MRLHYFGFRLSLHSVNLRLQCLKLLIQHLNFRPILQPFNCSVFFLEMDGAHRSPLILQLMNKIQKVRLVTLKSNFHAQETQVNCASTPEEQMRSIHSYFVMLRHIFQKNKNVMRRRNEFMRPNKSEVSVQAKKGEKEKEKDGKRELCMAITQQCLGIQKNNGCDFKKKQVRQYRPYRSKNHSIKINAKTLHTSTPNLQLAKEEEFTPIGDKFKECREVVGESIDQTTTSRFKPKVGTCINFYPRYEKTSCSQINIPHRGTVKKQRRTLLVRNKPIVTEPNQGESLRQSHKSAYSNKSYISVATESSEVPSPW